MLATGSDEVHTGRAKSGKTKKLSREPAGADSSKSVSRGSGNALRLPGDGNGHAGAPGGADRVYRLIVEEMQEGCATLDSEGRVLFCNRSFAKILRKQPEEVLGSSVTAIFHGPGNLTLEDFLPSGPGGRKGEFRLKIGSFFVPVLVSASNVAMGSERFTCLIVTDLSEQRRSQKQNELILSQAADAIIICDNRGRIVKANPAATLLVDDLTGRDFHEAVPLTYEADGGRVRLTAADFGPIVRQEVVLCRADGEEVNLLLSASRLCSEADQEPFGYMVSLTNIIELRRFTRELMKLDRLNLIGEMAAGIGHEVRNPMTTVRGYLQRFSRSKSMEEHRQSLLLMIEELDRANAIISEFLSVAKDKTTMLTATDLNQVVRNMFPLLQADAFRRGSGIELELGDIPRVPADEKEIRQCLLNLVGNGLDAMPDGGRVTVRTARTDDSVYLTVKDEGPGIPNAVREKLGTPFFTTKEHGTGLGLPVCYRIAQRHQAKLEVETGATGTAFHLIFGAQAK
jgi:two-component system, sporulation sensor kinase E